MYVAVKGGEQAIERSLKLLEETRRGNPVVPELDVRQIEQQLGLAVDRVMTEGSLYDRELAALAIKQAQGDLLEAIFLLRAFRTTLPRFGVSRPIDTSAMSIRRRISATFKDLPGGQILGSTYDYTQRLLDFELASPGSSATQAAAQADQPLSERFPRVTELLADEGLIEPDPGAADDPDPPDLTQQPLVFPANRAARLQNLARGDEGFLLALGYSSQRGYGNTHPFAAEIRHGTVALEIQVEELDFPLVIGEIAITECQMINQFHGSASTPPAFTRGYGLAFGFSERKAMSMALVDRSLRAEELGETVTAPSQEQEFVLYHSDNVEASGFVQHLKLPHYVDFQSELELVRKLRKEHTS